MCYLVNPLGGVRIDGSSPLPKVIAGAQLAGAIIRNDPILWGVFFSFMVK